jgi:hypothetical protein
MDGEKRRAEKRERRTAHVIMVGVSLSVSDHQMRK